MLETIISSTNGESFTLANTLIIIFSSILLGLVISFIYILTHKKEGYAPSFPVTLIMLPAIISIIILLVGNNVARAFSLAGAFSLIRFRSAPGDPKDIAYVFFTLAVGLTCGMGYIGYAIVVTLILCALLTILDITGYATSKNKMAKLKIIIPEDLNYEGVFDEVLNKFTISWNVDSVRTRDFGALFEIQYIIKVDSNLDQKNFIDELRCINGNLNITLLMSGFEEKVYG